MIEFNEQTADSIATINTLVVGLSPAMAMGSLYKTFAHATYMSVSNAVFTQQQAQMEHQTVTMMGIRRLLY